MRKFAQMLVVPALVVAGACSRSDSPKIDDGLQNDLSLASSAQAYQPQQYVSPTEQGYAQQAGTPQLYRTGTSAGPYSAPVQQRTQTVYRPASRPVYRTSSTSGSTRSAEPVRNTKRDAVIGAAAGAVLGAATSRDKVKGGLIGAAAGGILGAVVGHTVDVKQP
jgi:hypothetical protein